VPALNEAAAIASTVAEIGRCAPDFDVLVIDDGSTDGTGAAAAAAGARVVRLPFNLGIGGAVQTGYQYADERSYDVAVQLDGDGQHNPAEIHGMLERLRADPPVNMVTGSRFLEPAPGGYRSSAPRRAGIGIFARIVSIASGQRVTDPTSGFRLMHAHRLRSCEVPARMRPRTTGRSAISSAQAAYYMVKVLLAVFVGLFRAQPVAAEGDVPPVASDRSL
jgi:glycosyltransferase involved in cell wall biosynthesis